MKFTFCFFITLILLSACSPDKDPIDTITFEADACFGTCPIFTMTIYENGKAEYDAEKYNTLNGVYHTVIKNQSLDSLHQLINNVNWPSIQDNYTSDWSDQPTYTTTLQFKSGRIKTIVDYGNSAPGTVLNIYTLLFSLRNSQAWSQNVR
ncbi:DUF6438 domain-containing protein [Ferruginibacter sp. SUN106]|uniref:DUF6438 domain-containing protein n=1 Tax=Ferruginibacter sp. SUN106 TaxID=2978348 RepID=UPI003D368D0F